MIFIVLFCGIVFSSLGGYTISKSMAQQKLIDKGYKQVELTSLELFALDLCGKSFRHRFEAVKDGQKKEGYVCVSPFGLFSQVYLL